MTGSVTSVLCPCLQVVNDITTFYRQTYNTYQTSKDPRLKETLRVIQTGVRGHLTQDGPGGFDENTPIFNLNLIETLEGE